LPEWLPYLGDPNSAETTYLVVSSYRDRPGERCTGIQHWLQQASLEEAFSELYEPGTNMLDAKLRRRRARLCHGGLCIEPARRPARRAALRPDHRASVTIEGLMAC